MINFLLCLFSLLLSIATMLGTGIVLSQYSEKIFSADLHLQSIDERIKSIEYESKGNYERCEAMSSSCLRRIGERD